MAGTLPSIPIGLPGGGIRVLRDGAGKSAVSRLCMCGTGGLRYIPGAMGKRADFVGETSAYFVARRRGRDELVSLKCALLRNCELTRGKLIENHKPETRQCLPAGRFLCHENSGRISTVAGLTKKSVPAPPTRAK